MDDALMKVIFTGVALGLGGSVLYKLKDIPTMIIIKIRQRIIYSVYIYQYDELFDMLETWLSVHHNKAYRNVEAVVQKEQQPAFLTGSNVVPPPKVIYKQEENTFIFRYKGKRLVIAKGKEKIDKIQNTKDLWFRKYVVYGFKAKATIDMLLKEVVMYNHNMNANNSIKVFVNSPYGDWLHGPTVKIKPINRTIIDRDLKQFLIRDIDSFQISEDWYVDVSIPYKRGYCFYGPPGTGKTTLALALAYYAHRNVYCLNLNCIEDDSRLPRCFSDIGAGSVLLIEDIDKVFVGRENVSDKSKVTFSALLNCLDGAMYKHGLITIITTNYIDKLDKALIRTGRMDKKFEIKNPTYTEISEYLSVFYGNSIMIEGEYDMSMSDIQEICIENRNDQQAAITIISSRKIKNVA